jgi:hypothetical protein
MARPAGASGASPATIDSVLQEALSLDGGCLANQSAPPPAPASGVHIFSQDNRIYTIRPNGSINLLNGAQAGLTAPIVVDSTDETALYSYLVPAGEPAGGSVYQIYLWGTYTVAATVAMGMTFTSYYGGLGGDIIAASAVLAAPASTRGCMFEMSAMLSFYDAATATGVLRIRIGTDATTDAVASYLCGTADPAGVTVTSATDKLFDVSLVLSDLESGGSASILGGYGQRIA